ncbi:MAG: hypothetical protein U9Q05_02810 [Thermodesulfobacteriota bacterium]|nr:hypothetical protein [Thermodesulfobacteriota bacterium]
MSKWTYLGGLCWLASGVLLLYQFVGNMMKENYSWKMLAIDDVVEAKYLSWIDKISVELAQQAAQYIVSMPLYLLLLIIGGIFLLLSVFYKGR